MEEARKRFRVRPARAMLPVLYLMTYALLASGSLAGLLSVTGLMNHLTTPMVIAMAPVLYLAWLILFLAWGLWIGLPFYAWMYHRPSRMSSAGGHDQEQMFVTQTMLHLKCLMIESLPMARALQVVPYWQELVFRGYAPRNKISQTAHVLGTLWDPDLMEIGDDSMIGGDTHISCHSLTVQPDGSIIESSAPVVIGKRVTIGGDTRIALGAKIGDDSIVEPRSNVTPFTIIPAGEVWAGNPARFVRRRFAAEVNDSTCSIASTVTSPVEAVPANAESQLVAVRQVVANSLNLSLEQISATASTQEIGEWDSLGQMGIAAGIHSRFGISVGAAEMFCLRSVPDILRFLDRHRSEEKSTPVVTEALPKDPELLPLWDHEQATQALAGQIGSLAVPHGDVLRVVIASTFTAESVASSFKLWARAFGLPVTVEFAGFNQVAQELLSPNSLFNGNLTGLNVVLTRPEDLLADDRANSLESLIDAIAKFSKEANGTLVVGTLPPVVSKIQRIDRGQAEALRAQWRQKLSELPDVTLLDFAAAVETVGLSAAGQAENEVIARSPYSIGVYRELGILLARLARQRRIAPAKVVALDADGILWGGVIAEDGLNGIQLGTDHPGRSFRLFQKYITSLKANGQMLVLVSRNQEEDVWKVFDQHPEMVLKREDFAGFRINWQPKSQNIKELARELNLGIDSFVFIDDDVANRMEMAANAPGVTVVPMPIDPTQYVDVVSQLWRFDSAHQTAEDKSRTVMMQQERDRQSLQQSTTDLKSYLQSLDLRVVIRRAADVDLPRVAQLTQKTNQFNLSLKRRTVSEIRALGEQFEIGVIEASDRFGDYGLVGVSILERPADGGGPFTLDTLLMSCRVLGRGVEEATLHGLAKLIQSHGGQQLVAPLVLGPRNQPVIEFLKRNGFQSTDETIYELNVSTGFPLPDHIRFSEQVNHFKSSSHQNGVEGTAAA